MEGKRTREQAGMEDRTDASKRRRLATAPSREVSKEEEKHNRRQALRREMKVAIAPFKNGVHDFFDKYYADVAGSRPQILPGAIRLIPMPQNIVKLKWPFSNGYFRFMANNLPADHEIIPFDAGLQFRVHLDKEKSVYTDLVRALVVEALKAAFRMKSQQMLNSIEIMARLVKLEDTLAREKAKRAAAVTDEVKELEEQINKQIVEGSISCVIVGIGEDGVRAQPEEFVMNGVSFRQHLEMRARDSQFVLKYVTDMQTNNGYLVKTYDESKCQEPTKDAAAVAVLLEHEMEILHHLCHDNLVNLVYTGTLHNAPAMILEYAAQGNVEDVFEMTPERERLTFLRRMTKSVLSGLKYVHDHGVVHFNVSTRSIVVMGEKDGCCVKLADFQYAQTVNEQGFAAPEVINCYENTAPEVLNPNIGGGNGKADVWSLGIVLCQLLNEHSPFEFNFRPEDETDDGKGEKKCQELSQERTAEEEDAVFAREHERELTKRRQFCDAIETGEIVAEDFDFGGIEDDLTIEVFCFISDLLEKDLLSRPSAIEALKSEWMNEEQAVKEEKEDDDGDDERDEGDAEMLRGELEQNGQTEMPDGDGDVQMDCSDVVDIVG